MKFQDFTHITFDCYGTLIDWETGILKALRSIFHNHAISPDDKDIIRAYARLEAEQEQGTYKPYRYILREVMKRIGTEFDFTPALEELDILANSISKWPPYADTTETLTRLKKRYKLVILSNIDNYMIAGTVKLLKVEFDDVITSQQIGSYKPSKYNFEFTLERLGVPQNKILHVAQSIYHDHVPAKELGFTTVHINRVSICPDTGVAPTAEAHPDFEVPDLKSFVKLLGPCE
jgi:2-haloacid dehalogenase